MEQNSNCAMRTKKKMAAALKELMKNNSFDKITVSDISELAKTHRQTFYYHFQDRYELLDWLLYQELLVPLLTDLNFENMYEKIEAVFTTMQEDKKFYRNALKVNPDDLSHYLSHVATDQFTDVLSGIGRQSGIDNVDHESDIIIAEFLGYGTTGVVMGWANRGMKESPELMTKRIKNLFDACKKVLNTL